jgi:hypothetical protein
LPSKYVILKKENTKENFKVEDIVEVLPELILFKKMDFWIVIKIFKKPFIGDELLSKMI